MDRPDWFKHPDPMEVEREKITRRMDTEEAREFWAGVEKAAKEVDSWPEWKKAGFDLLCNKKQSKKVK